jgi:nucleoside-diphosphate-sugar epimerase
MTSPLKVCVTGHTGFVGKRLTRQLDKIDNISWAGASLSSGTDITQAGSLSAFRDVDVIVNLAGRVGVGDSWTEPADYFQSNFTSTLNVLEHARDISARVIHISSYLYGAPQYQPIDENHPVEAGNPYAAAKLEAERLCGYYSEFFSVPTTVIRPFNLFGPGQMPSFLVPLVIQSALSKTPVQVHSLEPRRDYLWIDDLARAICAVIGKQDEGFRIYNVGSGVSHSTLEVIEAVFKQTGRSGVISDEAPRPNELSECICDNTKFSRDYGWLPQVSLDEGISKLIEEYTSR